MKTWQVTATFVGQSGVEVTRTLRPIRDQFRSNALARALATGIPGTATIVRATIKQVGR